MYNQHNQGQHVMLNGGAGHRGYMQMNMSKPFQHHNNQHHGLQQQHHQDHGGHGGHGGIYGHHQHNISNGGIGNTTPHFAPNHLQNGTPNSTHSALDQAPNQHWRRQLELYRDSRDMYSGSHAHARNHPGVSKNVVASGGNTNGFVSEREEKEKEERHRAIGNVNESGQVWTSLDLGGQSLKVLAKPVFMYTFLTRLFLCNNKISYLPHDIGRLRGLSHLDASANQLTELPAEIGMLSNLREFLLFDNQLETLPMEMGSLYHLEMLGIEGNPLDENMKSIIVEEGTEALIKTLRENAEGPPAPADRDWLTLDENPIPDEDKFTVLSYNTLCDKYATQSQYGYTPSSALHWEHRKEVLLDEIRARNADICCLQEIDAQSFNEYFRPNLAHNDYKGVYWQKGRARTMSEKDAKLVDGCATFYKNSKWILLDKQLVDFANTAINRPDMKGEHDIFNRVMPRDDIGVVTFFENRQTGDRLIVANLHVFWNPVYKDVKVVQIAILMEQITKLAERYASWPACTDKEKILFRYTNGDKDGEDEVETNTAEPAPSMSYQDGSQIPLIVTGDFNSTPDSGVYALLAQGSLSSTHDDLGDHKYGNFTRDGMKHPFSLKSSYSNIGELTFTNYTPDFQGVIDYIWYSTNVLQVTGLLGEIDKEYIQKVPGFPNYHFPSDHLALQSEFAVKRRKEKTIVEPDFGPQRDRRT